MASSRDVLSGSILLLFLTFGIAATTVPDISQTTSFLLLLIFLIAALVLLTSLSSNVMPTKFYPLEIVVVSICLLFHVLLVSSNLVGWDVHSEYYFFRSVSNSGYWNSSYPHSYNTALSVTVLPVILQTVLDMDGILLFKVAYSVIFSLVPLILYWVYKDRIGNKASLLSAFFFMSYSSYYLEVSSIKRQQIAEVMLALLILLISKKQMQPVRRKVLMMIFLVGVIISHYATAYMLMFYFLVSLVVLALSRHKSKALSAGLVTLFVVTGLLWYIYTSSGQVLDNLVRLGAQVYQSVFSEFFNPEARPTALLAVLGFGFIPGLAHVLNRGVQYLVQVMIIVGVVKLWKERATIGLELASFALTSLLFFAMSVGLPYFAASLNMSRIYHLALIFLSPACILGGETIFGTVLRRLSKLSLSSRIKRGISRTETTYVFVSCVVVSYFLFNTGFVWEFSGSPPTSFSLGFNRMRKADNETLRAYVFRAYLMDEDVISAKWLSTYRTYSLMIIADYATGNSVLLSSGGIARSDTIVLYADYPSVSWARSNRAYIYLRYFNVVEHLAGNEMGVWRMSSVAYLFDIRAKIYSNGVSEIWI
ncbi:DUF2206 domain-containing protein [Candidatus Bathyarchaeota archaeon]|nr:DUF2206 domain-containing protein [Candidatus Bathyarchaeota archaeon]